MPLSPLSPRRILLVAAFALPAAVLAVVVFGRDPSPAASFRVAIEEPSSGRIDVALRLEGVDAHRAIVLTDFGASPELERVDLRASREDGTSLEVLATARESGLAMGRVEIEAPGARVVHVRYAMVPRMHAAAMQPRDRALPLDAGFGFLRGRDLFMLPLQFQSLSGFDVEFVLPTEWSAHAPWLDPGAQAGRPKHGAEELIASVIGVGRFETTSFEIEGTRFQVITEARIGREARQSVTSQTKAVAAYVADWFPNTLGPSYSVVVTPALPGKGEHTAEAWGTGQGGTFWPLTADRLHRFALGLLDAYLVTAPHRLEFQDPHEAWVPSGLRAMLAVEAVAAARGVSQAEADRFHAHGYATMPATVRDDLDLEALPPPGGAFDELQTGLADNVAPYVLRCLERHVQGVQTGEAAVTPVRERPLRRALHRAARNARIRSLWEALESDERRRFTAFREEYVGGRSLLPLTADRDSSAIMPLPNPEPAHGVRADHRVRLMMTAQAMGYLENCGCKINQSGGVARRRALIRDQRRRDPDMLLVDVGSSFPDPDRTPPTDAFVLGEQSLYLSTLSLMRYDAFVPGYTELAHGPSHFSRLAGTVDLPWTAANIATIGDRDLSPARVVRRGDRTIRFIGAYEPIGMLQLSSDMEIALDSLAIVDALESVRRECAKAGDSELVIVVGELSYRTIRAIVRTCPEVDVVVSAPDRMRGEIAPVQDGGTIGASRSGFLDHAYVMYADLGEYGLKTLDLVLAANGRVAEAIEGQIDLDDRVHEDAEVRAMLDAFYTRVSAVDLAAAIVEAPFAGDPVRNRGGYVGGAACASCHAAEAKHWDSTAHAHAYKTLLDVHRHYQPRCVSCHVVGFGAPDGYRMNAPSEHLVDVQCETCHGPGAAHASAPSRANIAGEVPERVCRSCHTPEHSNAFDYAERLEHVRHTPAKPLAAHDDRHAH